MILWPRWCSVGCWKFTISNLKKIRELSGADRWLLAQAFLALPLVALGLRCWGFRRLQTRLQQVPPESPRSDDRRADLDQARVTARLVQVAARYGLFRPTCLPQSLALWWLLRRQGLGGELRIGVRPEPSRLEAHAWVEFQGHALNDGADVAQRFAPFPREIMPPAAP
jgi:hypothetical protein